MLELPSNVKQEFIKVVPASIASEALCFVFFDNHPLSQKTLDITLCTTRGEIIELHNREIVCSLILEHNLKPLKIWIHRSKECHLYYLIQAEQKVFIILSDNELHLVKKIDNIESFDLNDDLCTGEALLQLKLIDDAVPVYLDDDFNIMNESATILSNCSKDDSSPISIELRRKLTSTQYSVTHNENLLKEHRELKYNVAFKNFQEMHNGISDAVFKSNLNGVTDVLKLKLGSPWIKLYGDSIVIILDVFNENELELEHVQILLQSSKKPLTYQTKLYESRENAPYWVEIMAKFKIKPDIRTSLVLCIGMESLQSHLETNFEFCGFILYKVNDREKMLPFDCVKISTINILRNELSLLSKELDKYDILAILATSMKTDLIFRHIKGTVTDEDIDLVDILCDSLGLEPVVCKSKKILLHMSSPYHVLHGLLVVFEAENRLEIRVDASVYFRTQTQILALIHAIQDLVPHRIIITTPKHRIVSKNTTFKLEKQEINLKILNTEGYARSLLKQLDIVKENYDNCIVKMNENKEENVRAIIGEKIDLMARGLNGYNEFKFNLESEVESGIKCLNELVIKDSLENSNAMFMDTDEY